jgi:hypothetical protein
MKAKKFLAILALPVLGSAAQIFTTPGGSTVSDGAVGATATFSLVNGNELQIVLADTLANPTSAGQLLSDLQFSIAGVTNLSLVSESAQSVTISGSGTATTGGTVTSGWIEGSYQGGFLLCVICAPTFGQTAGPANLIIGPGPYTNANGSIAGNGPHNPFLNQSATFILSGTGINANTTVSNVTFSFGTQFGSNVGGTGGGGTIGGGPVPEPGSATLAAAAVGVLALALKLRRRAA